ncbi:MAG: ABC transporter ATP-binding protein [Actinobacteria bacterium]|nr:MAG: ABC transporter ATP-binding protein [Actinomycetota bacterium]TML49336.1 MAG: ABC transporter ATP-binding protein [Actinomycetota bacterium]TML74314.1 MAG: ABC transporter ATP-binding protein [Actinomycetota bacterium]
MAYELSGVSRTYSLGGHEVRAVRELDLVVDAGEPVVVVGPSGSGKTTLLQLLGGLDRPTAGSVRFEGRDLAQMRDRELSGLRLQTFGFVFQQFNLIPTLTAAQNVEVALAPRGVSHRRDAAIRLLDSVGLASRADHVPGRLSGGEQQRVAIARALANEPHVLLADEPTGNLDSETGAEIIDLLLGLTGDGKRTVVVVTHDAGIAARARRVIRMQDGRVLDGSADAQAVGTGSRTGGSG